MKDFNAIKKNYSSNWKVACSAKGKNGVELVCLRKEGNSEIQMVFAVQSNPSNKNEKNKQN